MKTTTHNSRIKIYYRNNCNYNLAESIINFFWYDEKADDLSLECIKKDKSKVYRAEFSGKVYYIKYYHLKKMDKIIKNLFRKPEAVRHFIMANKLMRNKIPTVKPVLGMTKKRDFLVTDSLLVTEEIKGMNLYEYAKLPQSSDIRKKVIKNLAKLWAELINNKFWHKDPRLFNIMIKFNKENFKLILVDIDNIYSMPVFPHKLVIKNLTKLSADMLTDVITSGSECLTSRERILFFKEFTKAYNRDINFKKFVNRINDRIINRLKKKDYSEIINNDIYFKDYFNNNK